MERFSEIWLKTITDIDRLLQDHRHYAPLRADQPGRRDQGGLRRSVFAEADTSYAVVLLTNSTNFKVRPATPGKTGRHGIITRQTYAEGVLPESFNPETWTPHGPARHRIESDGRFIEKENTRPMQHGLCDFEPPDHTPGVFPHQKDWIKSENPMRMPDPFNAGHRNDHPSLRRFRAGIEYGISWLKRCMGLARCTWKGWQAFKSYVWSSIVATNLLTIASAKLATT